MVQNRGAQNKLRATTPKPSIRERWNENLLALGGYTCFPNVLQRGIQDPAASALLQFLIGHLFKCTAYKRARHAIEKADGWFHCPSHVIEKWTGLKYWRGQKQKGQGLSFQRLVEAGLIETRLTTNRYGNVRQVLICWDAVYALCDRVRAEIRAEQEERASKEDGGAAPGAQVVTLTPEEMAYYDDEDGDDGLADVFDRAFGTAPSTNGRHRQLDPHDFL